MDTHNESARLLSNQTFQDVAQVTLISQNVLRTKFSSCKPQAGYPGKSNTSCSEEFFLEDCQEYHCRTASHILLGSSKVSLPASLCTWERGKIHTN